MGCLFARIDYGIADIGRFAGNIFSYMGSLFLSRGAEKEWRNVPRCSGNDFWFSSTLSFRDRSDSDRSHDSVGDKKARISSGVYIYCAICSYTKSLDHSELRYLQPLCDRFDTGWL